MFQNNWQLRHILFFTMVTVKYFSSKFRVEKVMEAKEVRDMMSDVLELIHITTNEVLVVLEYI